MSAARYNLIIDQGTDFALEFIVKESGTAKNLSSGFDTREHRLRPTKDHVGDPTRDVQLLNTRRRCNRKNHSQVDQ